MIDSLTTLQKERGPASAHAARRSERPRSRPDDHQDDGADQRSDLPSGCTMRSAIRLAEREKKSVLFSVATLISWYPQCVRWTVKSEILVAAMPGFTPFSLIEHLAGLIWAIGRRSMRPLLHAFAACPRCPVLRPLLASHDCLSLFQRLSGANHALGCFLLTLKPHARSFCSCVMIVRIFRVLLQLM